MTHLLSDFGPNEYEFEGFGADNENSLNVKSTVVAHSIGGRCARELTDSLGAVVNILLLPMVIGSSGMPVKWYETSGTQLEITCALS